MPVGRVHKRYEQIFKDDCLLLQRENQVAYGQEVARNLLLTRTMPSVKLGLWNPQESLLKPKTGTQELARQSLTQTLSQTYIANRYVRDALPCSAADLNTLHQLTMVPQGKLTKRRQGELPEHRAAVIRTHDLEKRFRIAAVGYRVGVSLLEDTALFGEELRGLPIPSGESFHLRRTTATSHRKTSAWTNAIKRHVDTALRRGSHIVILPEFALPPDTSAALVEQELVRISEKYTHDHFIFAGTRHDGLHNKGLVIDRRQGKCAVGWHLKSTPSKRLGENVLGPSDPPPTYDFTARIGSETEERFGLSVAICYDAFDLTNVLRLIVQAVFNQQMTLDNILIVPSFNPSKDFVALLRDLSFLGQCIVVYVNGLHGDSEMFINGFSLADFSPPNRIMPYLSAAITQLKARHKILQQQAIDTHDAVLDAKDPTNNELNFLFSQIGTITSFHNQLRLLDSDDGLTDIVTVESSEKVSRNKFYHASDTLYYNVDLSLFNHIRNFQRDFFRSDRFLPKILTPTGLREALYEYRQAG